MKRSALVLLLLSSLALASDPKPKYGPEATLLSQSHEYIQKHAAPDFWALIPYYVPQQDDRACSVASAAIVVNGARAGRKLTSDDELATQKGLLKRVDNEEWRKNVGDNGHGVTLDELGPILVQSLKAYGVESAEAEVVHADDLSAATKARLHRALLENEKSADDFIVANFIQGAYTGDADAGHISPVAAYDAVKKRVLILDVDRQWYEPYWVSEETFLKGMVTDDPVSHKKRGYVWVRIKR